MGRVLGGAVAAIIVVFMFLGLRIILGANIGPNEVGVVSNFGHIDAHQAPLSPGYYSMNPFNGMDVIHVDTRPQVYKFPEVQGSGSDGQAIYYDVTVTYKVQPNQAPTLVIKGGTNDPTNHILQTIVDPTLTATLKELSPSYSILPGATDKDGNDIYILHQRAALAQALDKALGTDLTQWGIYVLPSGVNLTNVHADRKFDAAIEQTALSQQASQKAVADANAKIATAQGDAKAAVASAQGQHDANALLQASLTPALLEQQAIAKWDGHFPTTMSGGDPFSLILAQKWTPLSPRKAEPPARWLRSYITYND